MILLLCTVVTAISQIVAANFNYIFSPAEPVDVDVSTDTPIKETQATSGDVDWVFLMYNVAYRAETDGIVSAFSGGDGDVAEGVIFEGASQDSLEIRTRFGRYDGAVLPIRKGRYWLVQTEGGGERNLTVQWLALPSGP